MVAFIYGIGALITLGFFVTRTWISPQETLLLAAVAILLPVIGLSIALRNSMKNAETAIAGLTLLIVAGTAGSWTQPKIRLKAVGFFDNPQVLLHAAEDTDRGVQLAACRSLVNTTYPKRDLVFFLKSHPELAGECLAAAEPERAGSVASALAKRWTDDLESLDETRACHTAEAVGKLFETNEDATIMTLTDCAMNPGVTAMGRACCGEALVSIKRSDHISSVLENSADTLARTKTMRELLTLNFGENSVVTKHRKYAKRAGLEKETLKEPFILSSCNAILEGRGDHLYAAVKWVLNSQTECLSPELADVGFDVMLGCRELVEITKGEIDQRVCRAAEKARITRQKEEAEMPEPNKDLGNLAGMITAGDNKKRSEANLNNFIESATSEGASGFGNYTGGDLDRISDEIRGQLPNLDPSALRKDVEANKEKLDQMRKHPELGKLFDKKISKREVEELRKKGEALDEKHKDEKPR